MRWLWPTGQNFSIAAGFYTEWTKDGGIAGLGRPVDVQTAITAAIVPPATAGTTATVQTFANGAIYTINSGPNKSKVFSVMEPLWDLYQAQFGPSGTLGLPTSELLQVSSTGVYSQTFEGGALQYTPGSGPTLQLPVAAVSLIGSPVSGAVTLNLGQTLPVSALPVASNGANLTDRPVSWATTNGKVVSIQATGQKAVLTAVGGGTANVTASSGGVTSPKLTVTVIAPCCQIGDGAPVSVGQAFQAAIARNKLSIQVPVPAVAARVGNGYVQMVQSGDPNSPVSYMLAEADQAGTAYVVGGAVLARYQSLGGPAGALGYPASDQSAGGTQLFANSAALAGNPVRLVSGAVLAKWALLGYETGAPGPPTAEAASFSTLGANSGSMQTFGFGTIYAATEGPLAGQAYYVGGLILIRYNALGGAAGNYGMPVSDEFVTGTVHQQNFEGGNITYSAGDTAAVDHPAAKVPAVVVRSGIDFGRRTRPSGDYRLPQQQHHPRLPDRPARFSGDHGQRRLCLGHGRSADRQEQHRQHPCRRYGQHRRGRRLASHQGLQRQPGHRQSAGRQSDGTARAPCCRSRSKSLSWIPAATRWWAPRWSFRLRRARSFRPPPR